MTIRKDWTEQEIKIIKELYSSKSNYELSKIVNHPIGSIKAKGLNLGLNKTYWTEERIKKLKKMYKKDSKKDIIFEFKEKNWNAIRGYAFSILKLKRQVEHILWTNEEIKLLRKVYPICSKRDILKLFPNRSWKSIYYICNDLKIKRKIIANLEIRKFNLTDKEKGYIAGMLDGEGCLYFKKKGGSILVNLSIANTNLECLEYIKNILGCGHIRKEDRTKKHSHYKIAYKYELNKQGEVLGLLNEIRNLLIIKKEKYNEFLKVIDRWSNRERSNIRHYLIGKEIVPQTRNSEILEKRENLQELNREYYNKTNNSELAKKLK